jgi:repressor of nif and glnA expression
MIGQESREVERKTIAILRALNDCPEPLGGRVIARRLNDLGIDLGERAVRYHLKLMDQQGLTRLIGRRDGRAITKSGVEELDSALVGDRVGLVRTKMEMLAYQSSFDAGKCAGKVPVNVSLFSKESFSRAIEAVRKVYKAGLYVSDRIAVAYEGEQSGETIVPKGKVGLATVGNILILGTLLKAGILVDSRFGGILQIRDHQPLRFVNLIEYSGSSLDPSEAFVAAKMTSVSKVAREGNGNILASFCELPAVARQGAEALMKRLETNDVRGLVKLGKVGEPVCEIPVAPGRVGMILIDGLNPVAAAVEAGLEVVNRTMNGLIDFGKLKSFRDLSTAEEL